jgi:hypothetical protein
VTGQELIDFTDENISSTRRADRGGCPTINAP